MTVRRGISKDQILHALKFRGSEWYECELLGGEVLIKELKADVGKQINEAAGIGTENVDNVLFLTLVFQAGVIDEQTGEPLFTLEEVEDLREGRIVALDDVAARILALSKMAPASFRPRGVTPDAGQRDPDADDGAIVHFPVLAG